MVTMRVVGLSVDGTVKTPILLLQEEGGERVLPIWIGSMEAMNTSLALSGQNIPRPLTHDILLRMVSILGGSIESVEIMNFDKGTFYADLVVRQGAQTHRVDCRPSDGITLALKLNIPIYVHPEVLESAVDAEQKQDAASFQTQKAEDFIEKTLTEQKNLAQEKTEAAKPRPRVKHITITPQPKAHVKTLIVPSTLQEGDKDLEKLLRSLEPPSSKPM